MLTRRAAGVDGALASLFYVSFIGAVATSLVGPFHWRPLEPLHAAILFVHGGIVGLGHFVMIRALTYAPASLLSPFGYVSLIWAVLLGHFVFAEPLGWNVLIGGLMIALAGMLIFRGAAPGQVASTRGQAR
jgi:drug/metabolite transporter (DMT)-like permease